jgi:sortase (surface protein transpeptidase)
METGWYDGSRRLGASYGSTVIVGHRDSATQGSGALFGIEEIPLGSTITVTAQDGTTHEFIVDSVELIDKSLLPAEAPRIFTRTGDYRLVLITCGGAFDEGARSYLSNVVITALPAPGISE